MDLVALAARRCRRSPGGRTAPARPGRRRRPRRPPSRRRRRPARRRWPRSGAPSGPRASASIAASAPSSSARSRLACVEAIAITRPAPIGLPSWTASEPTPPAAATIATDSPGPTRPRRAVQVPRGEALDQQRQRGAVVDAVGDREGQRLGRGRVLGVAAGAAQGDDALPGVLAHAGDLAAGHERQLLGREVVVAALMGVGEVHARARDPDEDLAARRARARAGRRAPGPRGRRTRVCWMARMGAGSYAARANA